MQRLSGGFLLCLIGCSTAVIVFASLGFFTTSGRVESLTPYPFLLVVLSWGYVPGSLLPLLAAGLAIAWSWQLAVDNPRVPKRTTLGVLVLAVGSLAWFAFGWRYGLEYQGLRFVFFAASFSATLITLIATLLVRNARRPSVTNSAAAHLLFFGWLFSYAFPYLGEWP
jgi:hypothetical protein